MVLCIVVLQSCLKEAKLLPKDKNNTEVPDFGIGYIPPDFTWENGKLVQINVNVNNFNNQVHTIYLYTNNPKKGGKLIAKGTATFLAKFTTKIFLPNHLNSLYIIDEDNYHQVNFKEIFFSKQSEINVEFYTQKNVLNKSGFVPPISVDSDNDLVPDSLDDYPNDSTKAHNNFYPSENNYGTLAFEDLWPWTGDYDINDVVINYKYNVITNAFNKVVLVNGEYILKATGGSFNNGFGIEFPINRNQVDEIIGGNLENNQSKAVIILFDDMRKEMENFNTIPNQRLSNTVKYNISFHIQNGPSINEFGLSCYNPFVFNNTPRFGRGYEIHLPNFKPTDKANLSILGTYNDNSNIGLNKYYISKTNEMPWALNIPSDFDYPIEKNKVNLAYLKFNNWINSNGVDYKDWYLNKVGYRDEDKIFKK